MHYLFLYSLSLLIPMIGPTAVNVKNFKFLPDLRLFFLWHYALHFKWSPWICCW